MTSKRIDLFRNGLVLLLLVGGVFSVAQESTTALLLTKRFVGAAILHLEGGPNSIDIDGDAASDVAFRAYRPNFNAHGYTLVTFYRKTVDSDGVQSWELVPFVGANGQEHASFESREGADCRLSGIVALREDKSVGTPVTVIEAERDAGDSSADPMKVTFTVFRLSRNDEQISGWPNVYFKETETLVSRELHCDVGRAIETELDIVHAV